MSARPAPTISVIVPALDEADVIGATLERLRALRAQGHEIIVVDGGSGDGTVGVAESLATRVVHATRGRARQMNAGADAATGDVLLFLHADTRLPADAQWRLQRALGAGDSGWGRFDVAFEPERWYLDLIAFCMNRRSRWTGIATGDQAIFVDRRLFASVGGYPDIPLMEDIVLSRRLKAVRRPHCIESRVTTSGRRWLDEGVVKTVLMMWHLRLAFALGTDPHRLHRIYYRS